MAQHRPAKKAVPLSRDAAYPAPKRVDMRFLADAPVAPKSAGAAAVPLVLEIELVYENAAVTQQPFSAVAEVRVYDAQRRTVLAAIPIAGCWTDTKTRTRHARDRGTVHEATHRLRAAADAAIADLLRASPDAELPFLLVDADGRTVVAGTTMGG